MLDVLSPTLFAIRTELELLRARSHLCRVPDRDRPISDHLRVILL